MDALKLLVQSRGGRLHEVMGRARKLWGRVARPHSRSGIRLVLGALVATTLWACSDLVPQSGLPSAKPTPLLPSQSELPDLGDALVVVAASGFFHAQSDRTVEVPARMVVWDDGTVVVDSSDLTMPAALRSITLDTAEFDELRRLLADANLETYQSANVQGGGNCADCNVTILQTDIAGRTVELALSGLQFEGRQPGSTVAQPYPPNVIAVFRAIASLRLRVLADGAPWSGPVPKVLTTPVVIGG